MAVRVLNRVWRRRLGFAAAGAAILLLASWLRNPLIPYGSTSARASATAPDSARSREEASRRERAIVAVANAVTASEALLSEVARAALSAPGDPDLAFDFLDELPLAGETGVVVLEKGRPLAWSGRLRTPLETSPPGTSVSFSPFYTTLQVVAARGERSAVASALIHAEPPASGIATGLSDALDESSTVDEFRFSPATDTLSGSLVRGASGQALLRVDATPVSIERVRFVGASKVRGRGALLLFALTLILIAAGWSRRRAVGLRFFTLGIALVTAVIFPWNSFSNAAALFDPAVFYSPVAGPLSASAGPFALASTLLLLGVVALIRARIIRLHRAAAGAAAVFLIVFGGLLTETARAGIALPTWGATPALWIIWELPLFLQLFAFWLAATWLLRIAAGKRPMVQLKTGAVLAFFCGAVATFAVWTTTTEQRLQLAMRDVSGLQRVDGNAAQLLSRFGSQLTGYNNAGNRADLLKRYARSDLSAAGLQASLGAWSRDGALESRLDLAPIEFDSMMLAIVVARAIDSGVPVIEQVLGTSGRQIILAAPHRDGGATSVVASPRTRLIAENPYTELLGFTLPDKSEPPYSLILADFASDSGITETTMTWHRLADEWHGDQLVMTTAGPARAHVEVDLRSWSARLVRAALIILLNIAAAGLIWALATMAEGGFFRWVRRSASRWLRSYRGRLTLALFTFFVIPAVGFAFWSYQRLQRDDRSVRVLLIGDVLRAAASRGPSSITTDPGGASPLFLFENGILRSSSDSLYELIAPAGRFLSQTAYTNIAIGGELTASSRMTIGQSPVLWGYRAGSGMFRDGFILSAPARSDEVVLDRRRRDLALLVLFATAVGAIAAFWLSGIAARILARDLELSRIEVARAERVLAWGEMARQVAHEIKNPLTPIRLGVQHLRRAKADPKIDFDRVLEENVTRILSEIDRLDTIARAFSRYGSAPGEMPSAERVDVAAILRDVIGLEKMGVGGVRWMLDGAESSVHVAAREDELRDVLLNVFENARLARARHVQVLLSRNETEVFIAVEDDGTGIHRESLSRVFEPHFSTRTTGSGLGLAISRRLLESWGGSIDLTSEEGSGSRVQITLRGAET